MFLNQGEKGRVEQQSTAATTKENQTKHFKGNNELPESLPLHFEFLPSNSKKYQHLSSFEFHKLKPRLREHSNSIIKTF